MDVYWCWGRGCVCRGMKPLRRLEPDEIWTQEVGERSPCLCTPVAVVWKKIYSMMKSQNMCSVCKIFLGSYWALKRKQSYAICVQQRCAKVTLKWADVAYPGSWSPHYVIQSYHPLLYTTRKAVRGGLGGWWLDKGIFSICSCAAATTNCSCWVTIDNVSKLVFKTFGLPVAAVLLAICILWGSIADWHQYAAGDNASIQSFCSYLFIFSNNTKYNRRYQQHCVRRSNTSSMGV